MKIPVIRLDQDLPLPSTAHPSDAGFDLHARSSTTLGPGERALVPTGIAVAIPDGYVGMVAPRSGLAVRHGIGVVNGPGIVDSGYRGEIQVVLINHGQQPVTLERGDRIAQLLVVAHAAAALVEVDSLPDSVRGDSGFGSSGS